MRHAYGNANVKPDVNSYSNINTNGDSNGNAYAYANCYGDVYADCYSYGDSNSYSHAYADSDGYVYPDSYSYVYPDSYGNSNCHSNGDCDHTATSYTNAAAPADTAASPLAFFGIWGTRENELASSQPQVDRLLLKALPN